ncbi:MAG: PEP/pyruvate-binding domain-containing protein, partial [Pseudomonadota bacterium]
MTRGPVLMPAEATDPALAGGKAAALAALDLAGFAPPPFRVVHYDRALDDRDIAQILEGLGDGPFAVRSSGIGEDATDLSYAGQFLTELNVEAADLAGAIARVRRSGVGATAYTSAHGDQGTAGIGVNVIVQKMVQPRAAGVAFSADPVSGVRGRAVITAVAGLADRLVAGEVDGQTWVLGPDNTAIEAPADGVIDPAIAGQIADLARRAEGHFGAPQDIEWALDEAGLHILQSRPITTRLRPPPADDTAPQIFDNSNIVESYPGVVSPLTYSFAVYVYARVYRSSVRLLGVSEDTVRANGAVFDNMLGRIDGRVYYNLINWYRTLSLLPGFSLNRGYMETMMGVSEPMPAGIVADIGPPAATRLQKLQDVLRLGRAAFDLLWQAMILPRTKRRFYQRLNRALQSSLDLDRAPLTALAAE